MQTFLPYPSFDESARALDLRRLGKQRVETLQILRALTLEDYGWREHPAVGMWRGYEQSLVRYGVAMTDEWTRRGHRDTCRAQIVDFSDRAAPPGDPPWLGWAELHRSHQSALVRKDPAHYRPLFPDVPDDLPYVWPSPLPLDARPLAPLAAWVVRAPSRAALTYFTTRGVVALPELAGPTARPTKATRQLASFLDVASIGDALIVPNGERLLVGEITGEPRYRRRNTLPHVRDARWLGDIDRHTLRRPALLSDPRVFFALRGEDDPRTQIGRAGDVDTSG